MTVQSFSVASIAPRRESASVPATMPSTPAAIRLSRIGSPSSAMTATPATTAARIVGRSRNNGATSAMKHSGTANSSDHDAGIRLPAK